MPFRLDLLAASAVALSLTGSGSALAQAQGAKLFAQNCSACHQLTGKGITGAFPALAGDPFVSGPPKAVALVVLNGRGGMPTFRDDLSNAEIAAILTHVRSSWGNHASALTPAMISSARGGGDAPKATGAMQAH